MIALPETFWGWVKMLWAVWRMPEPKPARMVPLPRCKSCGQVLR